MRLPSQLGPTIRASSLQIACSASTRCLFDYLVGDSQQPRRNLDDERLGFLHEACVGAHHLSRKLRIMVQRPQLSADRPRSSRLPLVLRN
jgi:hypothetical protein